MEGSSQAHEVTPSRAITRTLSIRRRRRTGTHSAEVKGDGTIARAERVLTRPAGQRIIVGTSPYSLIQSDRILPTRPQEQGSCS
jgi:hypothetical protein